MITRESIKLISSIKAGHIEPLRLAFAAGFNFNDTDQYGRTALIWSCCLKNIDMIMLCIRASSDIDHMDSDGHSALSICVLEGFSIGVLSLLTAGANVKTIHHGSNLVEMAHNKGFIDICEMLVNYGAIGDNPMDCYENKQGRSLFVSAALTRHPLALKLLKSGINFRRITNSKGQSLLSECVLSECEYGVILLKAFGADVNRRDAIGLTPLMDAIYSRHKGMVKLLLMLGADKSMLDKFGQKPIDIAIELKSNEIIDILK